MEALPSPTQNWAAEELHRLNALFHDRSAEELLDWATEQFGQRIVLTCSFGGSSGMVLLDMVVRLGRGTPIVFLDTDLLFPETYALAERAERHYGITIIRRRPALTLDEQAQQEGPQLYERDPDRCCRIRKVTPLAEVLQSYDAWISGIRRDQSATARQPTWCSGALAIRRSKSTRWPTGRNARSGRTFSPTMCHITRCSTVATPAWAARRVLTLPPPTTREQAAGLVLPRLSAESMCEGTGNREQGRDRLHTIP